MIIILANLLVGGMIGLTGIAGFLLPMLYSGFMGMPAAQGMALSFFAFLISGVLGAWNYHRAKNLDVKLGLTVSAGSLIGASLGVWLNLLMDESVVKIILYLVVLGVPVKTAVGVALFNSIFIAIPSCIGYSLQCEPGTFLSLLAVSMISHGVGVWAGSRNTAFLKPEPLKKGVAVFSILIAAYKLFIG